MTKTPTIKRMQVIPVAGRDSMLMTLSGAHAPYFSRNIVLLLDSSGNTGVGEIHGGDKTLKELREYIPLVEGNEIGKYRSVLWSLSNYNRTIGNFALGQDGIQSLDISRLPFVVQSEAAVETAMLDLLGKHMGIPMCGLLGSGKQRNQVEALGYLFYVSDQRKAAQLGYYDEPNSDNEWFQQRHTEMLTPESIVKQAELVSSYYGFESFKLKGGVLSWQDELETISQLKKRFPSASVNIDPNGAWTLNEALQFSQMAKGVLSYIEDPTSAENGFSSREILSEYKMATGIPVATNMFATNWRQFYHSMIEKSVDIVLADPHFWTSNGSIRMAEVLNDWNLTWGIHSNNHFDITLATFAQCAAAAPGKISPIDTHWIWQDGQQLTTNPPQIKNGKILISNEPGLGIEPDMGRIMEANKLYENEAYQYRNRNDAIAMQYLIPSWDFDSKKPCLIR